MTMQATGLRIAARRFFAALFTMLLAACGANGDEKAGGAAQASPAPSPEVAPPPAGDHAVYNAVLRDHFLERETGEHAMNCEDDRSPPELAIVDRTRPIWTNKARRDSIAAGALPAEVAPLVAALRALDTVPRGLIDDDSLSVGVAVRLLPDSVSPRRAPRVGDRVRGTGSQSATVTWFSRVAYSADRTLALVHAARICRVRLEAEAEEGAYDRAILVALQWRAGEWHTLRRLYLSLD